ncbi:MAG: dioxygenase [Flavobacterium sp.]|nr:dioxygenase [Flavobacterium sp.]
MRPFHYAFKITDIESTRKFYVTILGCKEGRSTENWIDFDFFGNQLSAHISTTFPALDYCGLVDGVKVPIPHFGCVLTMEQFIAVEDRLVQNKIPFIIEPQTRYPNQRGEQRTMFVLDFSNNPIEFKAFKNEEEMF